MLESSFFVLPGSIDQWMEGFRAYVHGNYYLFLIHILPLLVRVDTFLTS